MQKSKNKVIALFFIKAAKQGYNIIAVQKLQQNLYIYAIYYPASSSYQLVYYKRNATLKNGLDYYLIIIQLFFITPLQTTRQRRCQKKIDYGGIMVGAQHLRQPSNLSTATNIKKYIVYLIEFFKQLVESTVPLIKFSKKYAYFQQIIEVDNAVRVAKIVWR